MCPSSPGLATSRWHCRTDARVGAGLAARTARGDYDAGMGGYGAADIQRWVIEPDKRDARGPFVRDRARVLHSAGLRRLAAKTQVVGPGTNDFHRTRLTHTLEVAQIGRELAGAFGADPDLVETACLAHDLGHPPFGHNGETVLDELASQIGGFEGNAQTLRLLTRLEAKTPSAGLNLTRATLDAVTKYPWPRADGEHKFGVYDQDLPVYWWARVDVPDGTRCFEAQLMDFADDVAYSIHDVEDGIVSGRLRLGEVDEDALFATVREWYLPSVSERDLVEAYRRLRDSGVWPTERYDGTREALVGLKSLTSRLITRFCDGVLLATRQRYPSGPLIRYRADLQVPPSIATEIAILKGLAVCYVMRTEEHTRQQDRQRTVISELVELLLEEAPDGLEPEFRADFAAAGDPAARRRVVIDQVAALTDASALARHRTLTGAGS